MKDVYIDIKKLSVRFTLYKNKSNSLKEAFINMLTRKHKDLSEKEYLWGLKDIDLRVEHGERLGIIGLNGAGKSTLLKTIANIYTPTSGEIDINGTVYPLLEIGAGFNYELSGRDNIFLNGAILGVKKNEMKKKVNNIIKFCELEEFMDVPIKYYSTGMYGRLAFTIATEINADILILDEIFAGGDAHFIEKAGKRLENLIDNSKIFITVSHSVDIIKKFCNRLILLHHGEIIKDGPTNEVLDYYMSKIV